MAVIKKGFKGNPLLRKAGVLPEGGFIPERQEEIIKCALDPFYFMEKYVYVKHVDFEKKILFKPRGYQRRMIHSILENRYTISRWPRQCGKTSCASVVVLWYVLFTSNYSWLVAAHKGDKARDIVAAVQDMFMELPDWLQQGVVEWNKGSFRLENGSRIRASTTSPSSARGDVYNAILLDEFAFVQTHIAEEFVKSVIPTVSSGKDTKVIITSTPKGLNQFYKIWMDAVENKVAPPDNFIPIAVEWNEVPGRDEAFREKTIKQYGQEFWDQEFACAFLGSSRTLISAQKLLLLRNETPQHITDQSRIYKMPEKGHVYAVTVDVAEGLGGDSSVVLVTDITTMPYEVAMIYENRYIDPMALPGIVHTIATNYNQAVVLVESNFGQMIGDMLWYELEYENVIMTTRNVKAVGGQSIMYNTKVTKPGVQMNTLTKRVGCANLKSLIENDQLIVKDAIAIEQLRRFAVKGKSYAAEEGHDDIVMAMVLLAWMADQGFIKHSTDVNVRQTIAKLNQDRIERESMPLAILNSEPIDAPIAVNKNNDAWLLRDTPQEEDANFGSWIFPC
jgi:hypothetical protein